jgi:hypothetical protein
MRMKGRFIPREIVLDSIQHYEIIEEYPGDKYLPSYLVFSKYQDTNGSIILFPFFWQQFMLHVLICRLFTAHSLRSFETQRTLSFSFFFLSAERAERKKQHPFGKFSLLVFIGVHTYDS